MSQIKSISIYWCLGRKNDKKDKIEKNKTRSYKKLFCYSSIIIYNSIKQEGKYGIINENGNTVIPVAFEDIGIKEEKYSDLTCKYILEGKYVPVKQNGKWLIKKRVSDFMFTSVDPYNTAK